MAVVLNQAAYDRAVELIKADEIETFDADWHEERPTPDEVNHFIDTHFMKEYGLWFLGIDDEKPATVKEHYTYPYGDLKTVQRCALVHTISHAKKNGHKAIEQAAQKLLEMVDKRSK